MCTHIYAAPRHTTHAHILIRAISNIKNCLFVVVKAILNNNRHKKKTEKQGFCTYGKVEQLTSGSSNSSCMPCRTADALGGRHFQVPSDLILCASIWEPAGLDPLPFRSILKDFVGDDNLRMLHLSSKSGHITKGLACQLVYALLESQYPKAALKLEQKGQGSNHF